MPYFDSRYADGFFYRASDPRNGSYQITVDRIYPPVNISFSYYVWVDGDRIDIISERYYGTEDSWWKIMDINPEISDPLNIAPGTTIRIPNARF
jgi:nucleoid-associated protein YgaU